MPLELVVSLIQFAEKRVGYRHALCLQRRIYNHERAVDICSFRHLSFLIGCHQSGEPHSIGYWPFRNGQNNTAIIAGKSGHQAF